MKTCPFCEISQGLDCDRIVQQNDSAFAIRDAFPVSPGHTLVIPKRHESSFFKLTDSEQRDVLALVNVQHALLQAEFGFADCNIGINDGPSAGQTVGHCHVHIIPRVEGDVTDPRGGVRWVIPEKADYWSS